MNYRSTKREGITHLMDSFMFYEKYLDWINNPTLNNYSKLKEVVYAMYL